MKQTQTSPEAKTTKNGLRKPPWRIALTANLKDEYVHKLEDPPDAGAEFDRYETIAAIKQALESHGHWVHFLSANHELPQALISLRPHIVFNIAEGERGEAREAQVPALCELLGIPYTASQVTANAISLNKTLTKRIWRDYGLPTANFQEFTSADQPVSPTLAYPLFVKPAREGTGMGIDPSAIVHNETELRQRVQWVLNTYKQPALAEEYLPGREFTVGYIGNRGNPDNRLHPSLYNQDGYHWFPILEIDTQISVSPGVYGYHAKSYNISEQGAPAYLCPANIPLELRDHLIDLAQRAAEAIEAKDVSRVDIRLDAQGEPRLMEINTLPGLNPYVSDLCIMAAAEGMTYQTLITEILYLAAERQGLPTASFTPALLEPLHQIITTP